MDARRPEWTILDRDMSESAADHGHDYDVSPGSRQLLGRRADGRMAAFCRVADRTGARRNRGTIERRNPALPSLLSRKRQPVRLPLAGLAMGDVELSTVMVGLASWSASSQSRRRKASTILTSNHKLVQWLTMSNALLVT
jgi:hypothetical protein